MKMNAEIADLSRHYQTALRRYLEQGPSARVRPAQGLGRQAMALGLQTLDLARLHEQALQSTISPEASSTTRQDMTERAKRFFAEALVPIEKTHGVALTSDLRVNQLTRTLHQRTAEASASSRHLEQSIAQREAAEEALKKSGKVHVRLLQESSSLQKRLRYQTREILSAQEVARQKTSHYLHDEIAQTLLAINISLLTLKTSAQSNTEKLEKEIADTQRLVKESVKRINRYAHDFVIQKNK